MIIEDLTSQYLEYSNSKNLEEYEKCNSELFEHYFEYWGDRKSFAPALEYSEIDDRKKLITDELYAINTNFESVGLNLGKLKIVLFVGQNYTNGHSTKIAGEYVVFLPVEGYETRTQVQVFVPHEIVHAIHYERNPDFYFSNKKEKETLSRLLISEGLATYAAKDIMGSSLEDVLWADYRKRDEVEDWLNRFSKNEQDIVKFSLDHWNDNDNSLMFYTADQSKVGKDREGYYLGFKAIEKLVGEEKYSINDLLSLDRLNFEVSIRTVLEDMLA